ncbi:hypothetical protein [Pseudomonas sp. FP2309]|uniref:hypothetical protein n=1 Tax=Pseudomonas sp. FP2309 TaxID=2954091 RepID=UPI0027351350|nr:hypothetical protein [Pseudomonas sp. FP2309]WLH69481.1 hypothetical protein PSH59_05020 [Pseudomonas sp. FP2309]
MAGGERAGIAAIAGKVANEIIPWLKWNTHPPSDQNFECVLPQKHNPPKAEPDSEQKAHNHPTDVVYSYIDPYTEKTIALNTDLKSYATGTIKQFAIRKALKSLAHSIDCARYSDEWKTRYSLTQEDLEIRGMLFVYNHDGGWDSTFYDIFYGKKSSKKSSTSAESEQDINILNIDLQKDQQIHILEPSSIKYIKTVIDDLEKLDSRGEFNRANYQFFYPDLNLHKAKNLPSSRPATLELISAPFMIIEYQEEHLFNAKQEAIKSIDAGYKIYYKARIDDWKDMFFLLDSLSNYQILNSNKKISIRAIASDQSDMAKNYFRTASQEYIKKWGKSETIEKIEFELIPTVSDFFSKEELDW